MKDRIENGANVESWLLDEESQPSSSLIAKAPVEEMVHIILKSQKHLYFRQEACQESLISFQVHYPLTVSLYPLQLVQLLYFWVLQRRG